MENTTCNLCGSNNAEQIFSNLPDLQFKRYEVQTSFVKCVSCGLVYQNPRPTSAEMAFHYPLNYKLYAPEPYAGSSSWLLRQATRYGVDKRWRFVTHYKQSGRLLDVGCATGYFLRGIREQGNWDLFGVEINEDAARVAQEYGLDVRLGTLEQARFSDGLFDVVTLWDVLEHMHDPAGSLREIYRILKPDGLLVIRIPNGSSWDARLFGRYWAGLDAPRHLYVFSPSTMEALLVAYHFQSIARSSQIGAYSIFLLSLGFWINARNKPSRLFDNLLKVLQHPMMRLLSVPLFYMLGVGLRGPSMVVTARKVERI